MVGPRHKESNRFLMTKISTFSYNGQDIEFLYNKGKISYVFDIGGKRYGNAVKVEGRTKQNVIDACIALIINFLSTYEAAKNRK